MWSATRVLSYRLYGEHPPPSKERTARDKAGFSRGVNRDPPALIQRDERNREHPKQAGNSSSQVIWEKKGGGTSGVRGLGPILAMPGARGGRREAWGQQEQQSSAAHHEPFQLRLLRRFPGPATARSSTR